MDNHPPGTPHTQPPQTLPTGTVTFLYTDIEGSTVRWERHPDAMKAAVERHDALLREAIESAGGVVFRRVGDAFCAAFPTAPQALNAALAAQRALFAEPWDQRISPLRVRMALHTGTGEVREGDYVGTPLNRIARLLSTGYGGQVLVSQPTFDLVRDALPHGVTLRDLGEHQLKDLQRPEHIYQLVIPDLPSDFPTLKTLDARPNNLPVQRSPLIGREGELASIQRLLLRNDVGLLTLVGPGGIGKTRLALQVAAELADRFADGVFFVPLVSATDPGQVIAAIAQAVGVKEAHGQPLSETLAGYLSSRQLLLLLDNFEQVVEAAPVVADLLATAPRLKVLVTSREVLHLSGEYEFQVPPLDLPNPRRLPSLQTLSQYDAVALFIHRAQQVKPDFEVTSHNAPAVAEICYRLDGLPLAIELAAARIRLLPPEALLARLQSRLKLLTGGARDLPTRHQTLRGTIQWSYDLLPPAEQMLFRRLSVFRGGCSLEAIEAVCNADGALMIDVLDGVASLADKSLVRQESAAGDEARILMLDTIREYATELLHQSGEQEAQQLYRQHALYYLMLAGQAEVALRGPEHILWLERLEVEHDNLRAAFEWAFDHAEAELALDLVGTLWHFWETRGYASEAIQWVDAALSLPGAEECTLARAKALMAASASAWFKYDVVSARRYAEESAAILRKEQSDPATIFYLAGALLFLGISIGYLSTNVEDYKKGREITDEALKLAKATGDRWLQATGMLDLGLLENRWGNYPEARKALEEGLTLYRQVQDKWGLAQVLNVLGDIERIAGQYDRAGELYEESLALYRELNARPDIPASLHNLGYVALALGNAERAAGLFIESLRLHLELSNRHGVTECLAGLAGVAGALGQPLQAARLFGASDALREALDAIMWPAERADYERNLSVARAQLDDATWQAAYAEGRAMSMEQAVAYAQEAGRVQSGAP